jgi:CelD/BcsL family acetyltransferase involved in cellulose biosynthesis
MLQAEVLTELKDVQQFASRWEDLAVACRRPRAVPAFVLAWYRHGLGADSLIRVVVVTDGSQLIAVAPFFVRRSGYGFYNYASPLPSLNGVQPLCAPGRVQEAGLSLGAALAAADPTPDVLSLDWITSDGPLPGAIREGWPRRSPAMIEHQDVAIPTIAVPPGGFDEWLAGRSRGFRQRFQSLFTKLRDAGFERRMVQDHAALLDRLPAHKELCERRREARGGSGGAFDDTLMAVLINGIASSAPGNVRLSTLERDGEVIASHLVIAAGGASSGWQAGFEEKWANLGPGKVNTIMCVADAMDAGDAIFDMGPGAGSFKESFTSDAMTLRETILVRRGLRPLHSPAQFIPYRTRKSAARLLHLRPRPNPGSEPPAPE